MGILAFRAVRMKSDGDGELSKVEGAAAVEVGGKCRVLRDFCRALGQSRSCGRKDRVTRAAQGVSVCAAVSSLIWRGLKWREKENKWWD